MTHIPLAAEDHRPIRRRRMLHCGAHLAGVHGIGASVVVEGDEHGCRVGRAVDDAVVRRVAEQPVQLLRDTGIAVLDGPGRPELRRRVPDHIEQWGHADHRVEELRPLGQCGADEQAAVRSAVDGELPGRGPALGDEPLGGSVEVVEDVLLAAEHAGAMPVLTLLAAAAEVRHRPDPAGLDPGQDHRGVAGGEWDAEAAVPVEDRGSRPVGCLGGGEHEHADLGAVLRRVGHLARVDRGDVDGPGRRLPQREFPGAGVEGVDVRNRRVIGVDEPRDRSAVRALDGAGQRPGAGEGNGPEQVPCLEVVKGEFAHDMARAHDEHERAGEVRPVEDGEPVEHRLGVLRDEVTPRLVPQLVGGAHGDASAWRIAVGGNVEEAIAPDVDSGLGIDVALDQLQGGCMGR